MNATETQTSSGTNYSKIDFQNGIVQYFDSANNILIAKTDQTLEFLLNGVRLFLKNYSELPNEGDDVQTKTERMIDLFFNGQIAPATGTVEISNFPEIQNVDTGLTQPLTDAELRATPVPISGTVAATIAAVLHVIMDSGAITETNSGAIKLDLDTLNTYVLAQITQKTTVSRVIGLVNQGAGTNVSPAKDVRGYSIFNPNQQTAYVRFTETSGNTIVYIVNGIGDRQIPKGDNVQLKGCSKIEVNKAANFGNASAFAVNIQFELV